MAPRPRWDDRPATDRPTADRPRPPGRVRPDRLLMDLKDVETPRGRPAQFYCRTWTSDLATVGATNRLWGNLVDEYGLPEGLSGWALDLGAHIGSVTVPLLLDNPELQVVAIEAVPDNAEMLRKNLDLNRVSDRCVVMNGAGWKGKGTIAV